MNKPKSNSLFHFTKNIESLKSILLNGLQPRYCLEDVTWFGVEDHTAFPISCFCDIPLSRISEHTKFYGTYGIGFTKEWGLKNNLNPVIYCADNGLILNISDYIIKQREGESDDERIEREKAFWKLVKITKPLTGNMLIGGEPIEKEFYQENEWRFTPDEDIENTVLFIEEFESKKEEKNKEMEKYKLEFSPADIKYIFVKNDADIPKVVDHINNTMAQYPLNDLKILNSRILSLKTVEADL